MIILGKISVTPIVISPKDKIAQITKLTLE